MADTTTKQPNEPTDRLDTIQTDGTVPECRVQTARQAKAIYDKMFRADFARSKKRSLVKGLVDGNPPYDPAKLKAAGRDYQCNVNWRIAESFVDNATGAFYDVDTEVPHHAVVKLTDDNPDAAERYSRIATEQFDWLLKGEPTMDYHNQISINEMVLYGCGPLLFDDEFNWMPISCLAGQLKVPERTKSDTKYWEIACIEQDYLADQLWERICDGDAAQKRGWNLEVVKGAIMRAHPENQRGGIYRNWEWYQQQLKNGSLYFAHTVSTIWVVHLFFREFAKPGEVTGKISHQMILADDMAEEQRGFLFEKEGRFDDWTNCVHPMYHDRGNGGFHHSVTGMGVKMYGAMEYLNRSICATADKVSMPDTMFKPSGAESANDFSVTQFSDYAVVSEGYDAVQIPVSKRIEETMAFNREVSQQIAANLSQYRTNLQEDTGNPITATEANQRATEQAKLGKTQLSRRYAQRDALFLEMYKRATDPALTDKMLGGPRAVEFRNRCIAAGIPDVGCLRKIESVTASRVVGQGSEIMRQQALGGLMGSVLAMLPETGRDNLITDFIATIAGQSNVTRYYPSSPDKQLPTDQTAIATLQVASMKEGIPAVVTPTQNPAIFAVVFLKAGTDAINSLQQGGDPHAIQAFIELDGQAIAQHLKRMSADKSRKMLYDMLMKQFKALSKQFDQLRAQLELQAKQQAEQAQQLQAQQQEQNGDLALKKQKSDALLEIRQEQHDQHMQQSDETHRLNMAKGSQEMALADSRTAAEIQRENARPKPEKNGG